ncbi:MAG: ribonuclease HII [Bacteroidota bacterium]
MRINNSKIIGCDEAGRGAAAGPVVAAAVILPHSEGLLKEVADSKLLTAKERIRLRDHIIHEAIGWALGEASAEEIDRVNILQATFLAMHRAISKLLADCPSAQHILVDGNRFYPYRPLSHTCIIKGDKHIPVIGAASILAKTARDHMMLTLDRQYADYQWKKNKGYPTAQHCQAIRDRGITPFHRVSYKPCQV